MKIAAWNVNSIKSRFAHLAKWIGETQPDIVMLQELKCEAADFPNLEISGLGYHAQIVGQKTYNGVAILSKQPLKLIADTLPGDAADTQARFIEAESADGKWRFISVYVPNGQEVGSDKFDYKLKFYRRLIEYARQSMSAEKRLVIGGDFNVACDEKDVFDAKSWGNQILFSTAERAAIHEFMNLGLTDCYRARHAEAREFSWWDYRGMGFERNIGLRIDC